MDDAQGDGWAECMTAGGGSSWDDTPGEEVLGGDVGGSTHPSSPWIPAPSAPRPRQRRRLDRHAGLTIVEAPPGFGKTTLAAGWANELAADGTRVVWMRATEDLDGQSEIQDLVVHGRADHPVIVVVDDAHLVRDSVVADSLVRLVRRARHAHLLVLADADHHFGSAATRHGQDANHLRAADLELLPEEIPVFASTWGHDVDPEAAARLHDVVGGWPLPLRLVLDASPTGTGELVTSSAHHFVTSRVLPLLADTVDVSTAARLAVPARLRTDLVVAIVATSVRDADARNVADALLSHLERHGVLRRGARRDGVVEWTYLPALRQALLDRLERTEPDTLVLVNRVVARTLRARSDVPAFDELLGHARSGEDWRLLAELWSEHGWSLVVTQEVPFERAYRHIPASARADHPPLEFATRVAGALAATEDLDAVRRAETVLHHYARTGTELLGRRQSISDPQHSAEILAAAMVAARGHGDLGRARHLAREAGRELVRAWMAEPGRRQDSLVTWLHLESAITHYLGADATTAVEHATTAHRFGPRTLLGAAASGVVSALHVVEGNVVAGRHWLAIHESAALTGTWAPLAELPARVARAMLALDRLDRETAETELAQVPLAPEGCDLWPLTVLAHHRHALVFGDPVSVLSRLAQVRRARGPQLRDAQGAARRIMDRCTVDLWLALAEVNRAETKLKETAAIPPWLLAPACRLDLMTGNADRAVRTAAAAVWREDVDVRDRTELLVTGALAAHQVGHTAQAREMFRRAHLISADTGNAAPFLLVPADLRGELLEATGLHMETDVLARLDTVRRPYPARVDLVRLSPREREVLRQIADHGTAADIARKLTVSVNTVKKQLVSLYLKLGVNDRTSALLRAEALGLLEADRGSGAPD